VPLDLAALTALGDLTAPAEPAARRPVPGVAALADLLDLDLPRRRVVALVAAAAVAGALCGLLAPATSALAAPLTSALSGALHPSLPDRPDPRPVPVAGPDAVDDAATADPTEPDRSVSAVDAVTGALRSGLGVG
jgi:hypothetical protein